ncbi:hypothetical protein O9929_06070 [Vibrio lentus]|nr:hypothetical protein [Vibrio lentus]
MQTSKSLNGENNENLMQSDPWGLNQFAWHVTSMLVSLNMLQAELFYRAFRMRETPPAELEEAASNGTAT